MDYTPYFESMQSSLLDISDNVHYLNAELGCILGILVVAIYALRWYL